MISILAPAKVNLYLHVVGKRPDGYHLLDSLFVFADYGDKISVEKDDHLSLTVLNSDLSCGEDNIIIKAARKLAVFLGIEPTVKIVLEKNLPIASGIGGGSTDAAATLLALIQLWNVQISRENLLKIALELGADVPSCIEKIPVQVAGIGEVLTPAPQLPKLAMILMNPNKPVSTPQIFKSRKPIFTEAKPFLHDISDINEFIAELKKRHNDLQSTACEIEPAVADVLSAFAENPLTLFSQMSGSGGTCFGLYKTDEDAEQAMSVFKQNHPNWWIQKTAII